MEDNPNRRRRRAKNKSHVYVNVTNCKYEIVRQAALKRNWKLCTDAECEAENGPDWNLFWTDTSVTVERVLRLREYQRINHFPGMYQISRKADLARTLNRMAKTHPQEYSFFPRSWVIPDEESDFRAYVKKNKSKHWTYIVKPNTGCQGKGIYLTRSAESVNTNEPSVAQRYLACPLLIDGYKFDLRIYLLVTSVDPLRLLLYREGLVRLCTERYQAPKGSNLDSSYMHLTNYAINKTNSNFEAANEDGESASKRRLSWFMKWVDEQPDGDSQGLWEDIGHICIATLIGCQPSLAHLYKSCQKHSQPVSLRCFELLGFDIMIDKDYKPWLIEVNHSPSFAVDSPLDREIKLSLVSDTMKLLNLKGNDRRRHQKKSQAQAQQRLYGSGVKSRHGSDSKHQVWAQYKKNEKENKGKFKVIFPPEDADIGYEVDSEHNDVSLVRRRRSTGSLQSLYSMLVETTTKLFQASTAGTGVSTGLTSNDRRLLRLMGIGTHHEPCQDKEDLLNQFTYQRPLSGRSIGSVSISRSTTPSQVSRRVYPGVLDTYDGEEDDQESTPTSYIYSRHGTNVRGGVGPRLMHQRSSSPGQQRKGNWSSSGSLESSRVIGNDNYSPSDSSSRPMSPNRAERWGMTPLRTTTFNFPQQPRSESRSNRQRPPSSHSHVSDRPRRPSTSGRMYSPRSDCLQACVHEFSSPIVYMKPRNNSANQRYQVKQTHDQALPDHQRKVQSLSPGMTKSASGGNILQGSSVQEYRGNSAARRKDRSSRGFEVINTPSYSNPYHQKGTIFRKTY